MRYLTRPFLRQPVYRISDFDGDLKLDLHLHDLLGAGMWFIPQIYERHERQLFCQALRPGCTVLDLGANIGIYTLLAAKRRARVFAVEPDPNNAQLLRHHVSINGFDSTVTIFAVAASDHEHRVGLHRNPTNSGGSTVISGDEVQARTLDSLNLPSIDLCKMDIEGSETAALRGMRETLQRSPSMKLLIEYNAQALQPELLPTVRRYFSHISVAGRKKELSGAPPEYCNLWCWN